MPKQINPRPSTEQERELLTMLRESRGADIALAIYAVDVAEPEEGEEGWLADLRILTVQSSSVGIEVDRAGLITLLRMAIAACADPNATTEASSSSQQQEH